MVIMNKEKELIVEKNKCCQNFANMKFVRTENVDDRFSRMVFSCMVCNSEIFGRLTELQQDKQSVQVIEELNKKGFSLDTLIVGGKSAIKFIIPDIPKIIEKTKEIAKVNKIQCESHKIQDIFVDDNGIFCKNCGQKLVLIPEWVVGKLS